MPRIIGILNHTPDSFSDGGMFYEMKEAQSRIMTMLEEGADIIDIGAASTSPGKSVIQPKQEWDRLRPLLTWCAENHLMSKISVDTYWAETAKNAADMGIGFINDVTGGKATGMLEVVCSFPKIQYIAMCSTTIPASTEKYAPDLNYVNNWAAKLISTLDIYGINPNRVIFDPGIGFATRPSDSWKLLSDITVFKSVVGASAICVGHSRKGFLKEATDKPASERDIETNALSMYLALHGVDYLRVHNVSILKRSLSVLKVLQQQKSAI